VLRISVVSIALAILVNSLTLAIVRGFQQKIKDKITGFNAPLFISKAGSSHIFEAEALDRRIYSDGKRTRFSRAATRSAWAHAQRG